MTAKGIALAMTAAALLAGCGIASQPPQPSVPQTSAYTRQGELLTLSQRIALGDHLAAQWWTLFASPPLNQLIRIGIAGNYDLAAARATLAQAQEAVAAREGERLPQVSLEATAGRQKYGAALFGPANFAIPPFNYYEIGPSASWTPDFFGRQRYAIERQRALADYQARQLDATYLALTANIVATTLELAADNEEIATVRRIQAADQKTLALVKASFALGAASRLDVLSAQTQAVSDSALLPALERRRAIGSHTLAILLGKPPAEWSPPAVALRDFALPRDLPLSLPSELAKNRPDIRAAQANLRAASAAVGEATANLYPRVTLSANMLQEALTPAGIFNSTGAAWALAAGLSAPIFNGGTLSAEKRAAQHAYQAALAQYRQTILNAFGEVADALTSLDHDDADAALRREVVDKARRTYALALSSYRQGAVGLLQVLDAQRALARAELALAAAQRQRYLDCVRLFVALGGSPYRPGA